MPTVYLNGDYVTRGEAVISVDDRGFTFGDGIYEGVRAIDGRLYEWPAHEARLRDGLAGLRIELGPERIAALPAICDRLLGDNALRAGEAFVYLAVSRGAAPRAHGFPPPGTAPTVFVSATRFVPPRALRQRGVAAITFEDLRWARCDWKTLNLLGAVLARQAAAEAGAFEAILVRDGVVTEGATTTVLAVVDGELRTHPRSPRILPGVTRGVVLACARELGLAVREAAMTLDELRRAAELLLCGTTTDVTPVVTLDGAAVGGGAPGPITVRLRAAFEARLYVENPPT
ncbi:MAG TPA: aminotransferase class IV [Kofleriaceae bacterium]|nr:aminotransferase class IV [Kofleriaceae bacterium]